MIPKVSARRRAMLTAKKYTECLNPESETAKFIRLMHLDAIDERKLSRYFTRRFDYNSHDWKPP
jgi:hypothetical protein